MLVFLEENLALNSLSRLFSCSPWKKLTLGVVLFYFSCAVVRYQTPGLSWKMIAPLVHCRRPANPGRHSVNAIVVKIALIVKNSFLFVIYELLVCNLP